MGNPDSTALVSASPIPIRYAAATLYQQARSWRSAGNMKEYRVCCQMAGRALSYEWYKSLDNIRTLVNHIIDTSVDRDEIKDGLNWVFNNPDRYRAEFVVARCRELDEGRASA